MARGLLTYLQVYRLSVNREQYHRGLWTHCRWTNRLFGQINNVASQNIGFINKFAAIFNNNVK